MTTKTDFSPNGSTPLPNIRSVTLKYKIMEDQEAVRLEFTGASEDAITVLGGNIREPVILRRRDVLKLPHNLVQCCLTSIAEGEEVGGLTPDIVYHTEDGICILEIGTTIENTEEPIYDMVARKAFKYHRLIEMGEVKKLEVIVVSPNLVATTQGFMDPGPERLKLTTAYRLGLKIKREFEARHGEFDSNENTEKFVRLRSLLADPSLKIYKEGYLDERSLTDWNVEEKKFQIGKASYEKDFENWDSFVSNHLSGKMDGSMTVVHLPMIIPEKGDEHPSFVPYDAYSEIISQAPFPSSDNYRNFTDLENESFFNQGSRKKRDSTKDEPDSFRVKLSVSDRLTIGRRGVMKKEFAKTEEMKAIDRESKEDVSIRIPTSDIDYFANEMVTFEPDIISSDVMGLLNYSKIVETQPLAIEDFCKLLRTTYFIKLYFLELVVREVAYNMDRNPDDRGDRHQFIIKRLLDYNCFVIIRTTRMSGDDSPCSFFVLFKGKHTPGNIFERCHLMRDGWMRTDFISLSRRKIEHLQGILPQHLSLWGMLSEQVGGGLYDMKFDEMIDRIQRPFRILSLILLEDKDNTSQNLQQLRYYYMQLFSGMPDSKNLSQKIIGKLTPNIRTRLMAYLYQNLIRIHNDIPDDMHKRVFRRQADPESSSAPSGEKVDYETSILSEALETPFGFMIYGPDEMLLASYLCMLHNKNEMNYGHGSVKMMEKVCKRQYQRADFHDSEKDYDVFSVKDEMDPDRLGDFQHSRNVLRSASRIIKEKISKFRGWDVRSWDKSSEREILSFILKTTLDEMATTKSSTNPYRSNAFFKKDDEDITSDFGRRKCLEQMIKLSSDMEDVEVALNIDTILKGIEIKEEDRIQVSLFKKNQIGGVREIYVLTMRGRLIVRVFCDILRCLCEMHPSEKLTNDKSKDRFVGEHFSKVKSTGLGHTTAKISGDMTNWAQFFSLYDFMDMCSNVLPPIFQGFCYKVLSLHRRKSLQLPESLVEMFVSNMTSVLSTPSVNRLKRGFLEGNDPIVKKNSPYIFSKTDMMQGILHYPSSFYHLMHLEYLSSIIKSRYSTSDDLIKVIVSFEVSSDDEGILVSFCGDDVETKRVAWRFYKEWPILKNSVDKLFGVRTSFEKTTFSLTEMFEFNSKFYIGNSVSSPLVKFVARSCDDNPQESLGRRVSAMYSQLRQLRENGGSGDLCSWVSMCQCLALNMNYGFKTMPWLNADIYRDVFEFKVTPLGFYASMPPLCAGLVDGVYVNWRASGDPSSRRLLYHVAGYGLPNDEDDLESAMYSAYPTRKYSALKARLGLSGMNRRDLVGEREFESLLRQAYNKDESVTKMKYIALDPTIAASLSWLSRTESIRMTPFLLYAAMFKTKSGSRRSIRAMKEEVIDGEVSVDQRSLFPMWFQFRLLDYTLSRELISARLPNKKRLRYQWISPEYSVGDHFRHFKTVVREIWFKKVSRNLSRNQVVGFWDQLKKDIPFLRDSHAETLHSSPYSTYAQLLGFIESTAGAPSSIKLLARGVVNSYGQNLETLMRHNISPFAHYSFKDEPELAPLLEAQIAEGSAVPIISPKLTLWAQKSEDRVKAWYELSSQTEQEFRPAVYDLMYDDFKQMMTEIPPNLVKNSKTGSSRLDRFILNFRLMVGNIGMREFSERSESFRIWIMPDNYIDGDYDQTGSYIQKKNGTILRANYHPSGYRVIYDGEDYHAREMMKNRRVSSIKKSDVEIVDVRGERIQNLKGTKMVKLFSLEGPTTWFMSPPDVTSQTYHYKRSESKGDMIETWLSRSEPDDDAIEDMTKNIKDRNPRGELLRAISKYSRRIARQGGQLRIAERLDHQPEIQIEEDYMAAIDGALDDMYVEEVDDADFNDFYIEGDMQDAIAGFYGIEAFASEQHIVAMELNPCLREITVLISHLSKYPKSASKSMREYLEWYSNLE